MPNNNITYSFVGGSAKTRNPNIQGASISRNMFTGFNGVKGDERRFMQSCPGIKYIMSLGDSGQIDGMYVPSTGLSVTNFTPELFVAYYGTIYKIDNGYNVEAIGK